MREQGRLPPSNGVRSGQLVGRERSAGFEDWPKVACKEKNGFGFTCNGEVTSIQRVASLRHGSTDAWIERRPWRRGSTSVLQVIKKLGVCPFSRQRTL